LKQHEKKGDNGIVQYASDKVTMKILRTLNLTHTQITLTF